MYKITFGLMSVVLISQPAFGQQKIFECNFAATTSIYVIAGKPYMNGDASEFFMSKQAITPDKIVKTAGGREDEYLFYTDTLESKDTLYHIQNWSVEKPRLRLYRTQANGGDIKYLIGERGCRFVGYQQ
jgi:hypothetical protein